MKVKRFVALDMRSALTQIREELSADAVIMSTRTIAGGGVEVLAAYNPEETPVARDEHSAYLEAISNQQFSRQGQELRKALADIADKSASRRNTPTAAPAKVQPQRQSLAVDKASATKKPAAARKPVAAQSARPAGQLAMGAMQSELNSIRNLLEQRLSGLAWEQFAKRTPVQAAIWERLNSMNIPGFLSKQLLDRVTAEENTEKAWRNTLAHLTRSIPVVGEDMIANGGRFALLGSTGVGKTTTIGKLATRFVLKHGADSVALVTTDSYRIAAHEQLRALGRILGVTVRVVDRKHDLGKTLEELQDRKLVLIDTAGLSPTSTEMQEQLKQLQTQPGVKKLLVMACTSQGQVLRSAFKAYSTVGLSACILTRLDETTAFGDALALAIDHQLPVAYETFGQAIPEDIRVAQAHRLISRAVSLSREAEVNKEQLMSEFGGVLAKTGEFRSADAVRERSF